MTSPAVPVAIVSGDENGSRNLQRGDVLCVNKVPRKLAVLEQVERGVMAD